MTQLISNTEFKIYHQDPKDKILIYMLNLFIKRIILKTYMNLSIKIKQNNNINILYTMLLNLVFINFFTFTYYHYPIT